MTNTKSDSVTIDLDTPIARGEQTIAAITLRKPKAGELRGIHLAELLQLDVNSLQRVLPRISEPALTEQDVSRMDPADVTQLGMQVASFLLPKSVRTEASLTE